MRLAEISWGGWWLESTPPFPLIEIERESPSGEFEGSRGLPLSTIHPHEVVKGPQWLLRTLWSRLPLEVAGGWWQGWWTLGRALTLWSGTMSGGTSGRMEDPEYGMMLKLKQSIELKLAKLNQERKNLSVEMNRMNPELLKLKDSINKRSSYIAELEKRINEIVDRIYKDSGPSAGVENIREYVEDQLRAAEYGRGEV
ncbi:hypothetical protein CRG98_014836 [Punica granatum]|uniref:Uncharacterized protein n=1 Tax=Punica granatum TaxID=22663 RepID=A0A2I0K892_PUNGR|nr:hypothetical protein CRG98_014836 [Punica granatum]